jgi:hypothetical protein
MLLDTLLGTHRPQGKYHVTKIGNAGINGMKTSASVVFVLNPLSF